MRPYAEKARCDGPFPDMSNTNEPRGLQRRTVRGGPLQQRVHAGRETGLAADYSLRIDI